MTQPPARVPGHLPSRIPVVVVGAGQAGLAAAHELVHRGLVPGTDFLILDADTGPGGAWQHRWDSLTLGRAHGIADLPGLKMERPDPQIPASRLVADYYRRYEETFSLRVVRPVRVISVHDTGDTGDTGGADGGSHSGELELTVLCGGNGDNGDSGDSGNEAGGICGTLRTRILVNATGTWTHPYIPYVPGIADFTGRQLHTVDYVRSEDFAGQKVLVVGGGLSAVQFLLELNRPGSARETVWATRRPRTSRVPTLINGGATASNSGYAKRLSTGAGPPPSSATPASPHALTTWMRWIRGSWCPTACSAESPPTPRRGAHPPTVP